MLLNTVIVAASLCLVIWSLTAAWRSRVSSVGLALPLGVAATALAARDAHVLITATPAPLDTEIALLVCAAALALATTSLVRKRSALGDRALTLLGKTPNPMLIKDSERRYQYVNEAFLQYFPLDKDDFIGKRAEQLWPRYLSDKAEISDKQLLETGEPVSYDIHIVSPDGVARDWFVSKFPLTQPDGSIGIAAIYTDMTEQRASERRLIESEERYALASEHAGIWDWELETDRFYISPGFVSQLGLSELEARMLTSETVQEHFHPDDVDGHRRAVEVHLKNPRLPFESNVRFRVRGGAYRWFHVVGRSLRRPDGRVRRLIGMITDIDDMRRASDALTMSEARMANLLDNSPAPIYFKDRQLRFVVVNRHYCEAYGVRVEDVIGRTSYEIYKGSNQGEMFFEHDKEVLEKRTLITHEEKLGDRTMLTSKFPILDKDGNLMGIGGIETDITEQIQANLALRDARDEAEAASRAKSAFLANMSHELRTPLNSIIGFSSSLLAGTVGEFADPRQREYVNFVRSAGEHLLDVINDILDLSRIEAGKLKLEESRIDVAAVVASSISLTSERANAAGICISGNVAPDIPQVLADERQLKQVILNLLSNAIKFTPKAGQISVNAQRLNNGDLEIIVRDNGIGIEKKDLERIQQPFVQVADSLTRHHAGTGLGLSIVHSIVAMHGGAFRLESTPGKGTSAIVTLPAKRMAENDANTA